MAKAGMDPAERKARVRSRIEQSGQLPMLPGICRCPMTSREIRKPNGRRSRKFRPRTMTPQAPRRKPITLSQTSTFGLSTRVGIIYVVVQRDDT